MKIKVYIFIFFIWFTNISCGQNKNKEIFKSEDLKEIGLLGNVKKVTISFYTSPFTNKEPYPFLIRKIYFDQRGLLTRIEEGRDYTLIIRDSLGKKKEERKYSDEKLFSIKEFKDNLPVNLKGFDNQGIMIWKTEFYYDKHKNLIKEVSYDKENKIKDYFEFKYDINGNEIERKKFNSENELMLKNTSKYDKLNNQIEFYIHDEKSDKIIVSQKFEYNTDNNLMLVHSYGSTNQFAGTKRYSNEIVKDNIGNWISKTSTINGEVSSIAKQEIEYYD